MKPTSKSERLQVVDALRGFALFGILLANLYSFMGYTGYSPKEIIALPTSDRAVLFIIDWIVEGKFYGIFSILFGISFALQAERFRLKNSKFSTFWFRRMMVLLCFGLVHMLCVWHGDILTLYSLLGMLLPQFLKLSDRTLLRWIFVLLVAPLFIYAVLYLTPEAPLWSSMRRFSIAIKAQWGFTDSSLAEMRISKSPTDVFSANVLYALPRPMSYLTSGRYFHVLGLFVMGILLARIWLPKIRNNNLSVPKTAIWLGALGLIFSFLYAITKFITGSPFELNEIGIIQVIAYNVGSTSLALGIAALFLHWFASGKAKSVFQNLAMLGRMALTNYIFQNVAAVLLFFGYGFSLMGKVPFIYLPLFACGILLLQWLISYVWLKRHKQGPLEFVWKKLTYHSSKPN